MNHSNGAFKELYLKSMIDAIPDLIFFKDLEGKFIGCNKAFAEKIIGKPETEIVGKTEVDLFEDQEMVSTSLGIDEQVFSTGTETISEIRLQLRDGRTCDYEMIKAPFCDSDGRIVGLVGISRDITERKQSVHKESSELGTDPFASDLLMNRNILIVDSNESDRNIIIAFLAKAGCKVFEADGASSAITTILENDNTENHIELALIDYQMKLMNGFELAKALKVIPCAQAIRLIMISSTGQQGEEIVAKEHGFEAYLSKPFHEGELLESISLVFARREQADEKKIVIAKDVISEGKSATKPRLLLVEDNEMNRKIVNMMLSRHNYACDFAANGVEALEAVKQNEYDVVFMDCQMPVMDGYECTKRIREYEGGRKHTRIVAMTANAMEGDKEKCIEAGMDEYLSKPVNFELMFQIIGDPVQIGPVQNRYSFIDESMEAFMIETGVGPDDTKELFDDYMNMLPELFDKLDNAFAAADSLGVRAIAHQIKGSAANLRLKLICEKSMEIENAAKTGDLESCRELIPQLKAIFN